MFLVAVRSSFESAQRPHCQKESTGNAHSLQHRDHVLGKVSRPPKLFPSAYASVVELPESVRTKLSGRTSLTNPCRWR